MPVFFRAALAVVVVLIANAGWSPAAQAQRFIDVPTNYWAYSFIETLADSGVTSGCGSGNYCPENAVTRAQMAVFIERGIRGAGFVPPPATGAVFLDVAANAFAAGFIEQFFADGITGGCGNGNYCPNDPVTRAQMAVFLERGMRGSDYVPPPPSGVFGDVPVSNQFAAWIEQLAADGITGGCGNNNYCPNDPVTRAQMAVFLVRAFGLVVTPPALTGVSPVDGATNVTLAPVVSATFSEPVAGASLNETTFSLSRDGIDVPATVILVGNDNRAKLGTDRTLALLTDYTATLSSAITDLSGTPLPETSWSFTSRDGTWRASAALIGMEESGAAYSTQIAVDPNGNAFAVWTQGNGVINSVWSNRYIVGRGWQRAVLIETDDTGNAFDPQIAVDENGNALAVWTQSDGMRANVWSNRYVAGIGWGSAELIETDDTGNAFGPQIGVDENGNALAVWRQFDGARLNVWSNRYAAGIGWGSAELIEMQNDGSAFNPQVAVVNNGDALAIWSHFDGADTNIWSNRYVAGSGWGSAELIESDPGQAVEPQIAVDDNGNALAVWTLAGNIWSNRYVAGSGWGSAELIETDDAGSALEPRIAVDASGNALAVWAQSDGLRDNIWSNRYAAGIGWGIAELVETDDGAATAPRVGIDDSGNALAVWAQSDGLRDNLWSNRYVAGSGWATAGLIETNDRSDAISASRIAVDDYGNAIIIWTQSDDARFNIFFNRLSGGGEPTSTLISDALFSDLRLGDCIRAAAAANAWHFVQEVTTLDCSQPQLQLLGGIEQLVNLESLDLSGTLVYDLSRLGRLRNLQDLNLSSMPNLVDIEPLTALGSIATIDLSGSSPGSIECASLDTLTANGASVTPPPSCRQRIVDITNFADPDLEFCLKWFAALAGLTFADELRGLDCGRDLGSTMGLIGDLSGIESFTNLEEINFSRQSFSDLTPLAQLPSLRTADLSGNFIDDISPLAGLPLETVSLKSIPFLTDASIGVLQNIPTLRAVELNETEACASGSNACVTGRGDLDCRLLDTLAAGLEAFSPPARCNMPIAEVVFPDANLATCVADWVAMFGWVQTRQVNQLRCRNLGIQSLDGLERFGEIQDLWLDGNQITDLAPLNNLRPFLTFVNLTDNLIRNFHGLSKLHALSGLEAANITGLQDISTLTTKTRLFGVNLNMSGEAPNNISCADVAAVDAIVMANGGVLLPPLSCDNSPIIIPEAPSTDIDLDGDDDLVLEHTPASAAVTASWSLTPSLGNSFGFAGGIPAFDTTQYTSARVVGFADALNDGRDDLLFRLISAADGSVNWQVRLSSGGLRVGSISLPGGDDARAIAFEDVDGDGYADILIRNQVNQQVNFYLSMGGASNPYTSLSQIFSFDVAQDGRPEIIALEDINNDGTADLVLDIALNGPGSHCFAPVLYRAGTGFGPQDEIVVTCGGGIPVGVADLDGDEVMELVVSTAINFVSLSGVIWRRAQDWSYLTLNETALAGGSYWDDRTKRTFARESLPLDSEVTYRTVALADLDDDGREDLLLEVTDGLDRSWIVHAARTDATEGYLFFERQVWLQGQSNFRTLGLRDYNNDDRPDLLLDIPLTETGQALYVQENQPANLCALQSDHACFSNSLSIWRSDNAESPRVLGLEEEGLTVLANNNDGLVAWSEVRGSPLYTQNEFAAALAAKGLNLVMDDTPLTNPNDCKLTYFDSDKKDLSVEFGLVACKVEVTEGVQLKTQSVYGGCDISNHEYQIGGSECEIGTVKGTLEVDIFGVEQTFELEGPKAGYCASISLEKTCANFGAQLVGASRTIKAAGVGLGAGVSVGPEAGFDEFPSLGVEDGVISGSFDARFGVGIEFEFSVDYNETGRALTKVGETGYAFVGDVVDGTATGIVAAGTRVYDAAAGVADDFSKVTEMAAGDVVYLANEIYYVVDADSIEGLTVDDVINGVEAGAIAVGNVLEATGEAVIDVGTGAVNGVVAIANDVSDFFGSL